ncbi:MAG: hypothetical protein GXO98_03695 [Nitrospirae bacterium]|nr:hypothetical protein [Nitrospirota bacterium]
MGKKSQKKKREKMPGGKLPAVPLKEISLTRGKLTLILSATFIVSLSLLMFEVLLTRIFSVIIYYHSVFMIVSAAIFGLGLGAITLRVLGLRPPSAKRSLRVASLLCLLLAFSLSFSTIFLLKIPNTDSLILYGFIALIPFFFGGMFLSFILERFTWETSKIYFADLTGGALGTLLVLLLLQLWGGINSALFLGVLVSLAGLILGLGSEKKVYSRGALVSLILLSFLFGWHLKSGFLDASLFEKKASKVTSEKTIRRLLDDRSSQGKIVYTTWNAFARIDVVDEKNRPLQKTIFTDGGAGTSMFKFDGDFGKVSYLDYRLQFFPFYFGKKEKVETPVPESESADKLSPFYFGKNEKVLIIGSGGGVDVLNALRAGVKEITAVEINPAMVKAVNKFSEFNGGIYNKYDNIKVVVEEGRSFIKRTKEKYDLIFLPLVFTTAAETIGFSLAENYVFTKEAFQDYLDRLRENGRLVIMVHGEPELLKLLITSLSVLGEAGKDTPTALKHIAMLQNSAMMGKNESMVMFPLFILKKSEFTPDEGAEMRGAITALQFTPLFIPYSFEKGLLLSLMEGKMSPEKLVSEMKDVNLQPATDDRPFFYNFSPGIPDRLKSLLLVLSYFTPLFLLPLFLKKRGKVKAGHPKIYHFLFYFASLGAGFMLIEISLIQKFILFLGEPTLTFSVILFALFLSAGLGSLTSHYFREKLSRRVSLATLGIAVLAITYAFLISPIMDNFLSLPLLGRSLLTMVLIFPLGFLMGIPFPAGLRILKKVFPEEVPWMYGVNGITSVLGSAGAVALAMLFGFTWSLLLGGVIYSWIFWRFRSFSI